MRKIYSFAVAAVALLTATSCNKELPQGEVLPVGETVIYTASVDGADTKAVLNDETKKSEWVAGDAITVYDGTKGWTFTADKAGQHTDFSNSEGFGEYRPVLAVYPTAEAHNNPSVSYTANVAAKTVKAYIPTWQQAQTGTYHSASALAVAYSEGNSFAFKNAHALLKFTVNADNVTHVIFHGNKEEALTGNVNVTLGDEAVESVECLNTEFPSGEGENQTVVTKKGTWVECYAYHDGDNKYFVKGKTYYIAVAPQVFENGVTVKVKINEGEEIVAKTTTKKVQTKINTILNLGEIDPNYVDASTFGVVGSFQGWAADSPAVMEYVSDGWIVAKSVELYKNDEFKFISNDNWYGVKDGSVVGEAEVEASTPGNNIKVSTNGKFNLYLNPITMKVKVECVEEYTDLMVDITIDNKANWSPLYITLKDGDNLIADNVAVTDNKYQISGDYIGSTLTYTLSNGTKTTDVRNVAINKTGATVTLEETIVKLMVQLNTANAKQWWGNTMKIHVWNTGTSFDTSWPGNTMTSEGNYTWSIIVPSELVGKTINFLVHNGDGWQSSDSKVTIKAEGNTVTGSSIGIN